MKNNKVQIFTEVNSFLNSIDEKSRNKIPQYLRRLFNENSVTEFQKDYDLRVPLYTQDICRETLAIIALLHMNYLCKNEQEKNEIWNLLKENEIKNEEEKIKKFNSKRIFNIEENLNLNEKNLPDNKMIVYKENKFLNLLNKIKKMFLR